ncbi:MAG TPA: universal stress protein [Xanthobacteraceae bacterium]|jgi:nucleotide-binding universal stress UspA family protein
MIKDLLVNLATGVGDDATVDYAVSLARLFDAHLAGVAFAYDAIPPAMLAGEVSPAWIEELHKEAQVAAQVAAGKLEKTAKRAGISAEARWLPANLADPAELFGRMARRFDLAVVRQAEPGRSSPAPLVIEAALFETGRPVLVVPYIQKTGVKLDRVMLCWDGSRSAARAAADAMPFLQRAKTVEVAMVTEGGKTDETPGVDIAQHLARHGVTVEVKQIVAPDTKTADVLLSHLADTSADLMVLGGYGHSRLREFVLGGVTRSILDAMTAPTLMSH